MDSIHLKKKFNHVMTMQRNLKEHLAQFQEGSEELIKYYHIKCSIIQQLEACKELLVGIYEIAIRTGTDVDNSRLLKVYQFFYRNASDIQHHLQHIDIPRGSTAIWGIVVLIAVIYLWATV
ncbi:unnamed protein product [Caenorhabditis brenneri]